jgi:hypothetical protein
VGDEVVLRCDVCSGEAGRRGRLGLRLFCQDGYRLEWWWGGSMCACSGIALVEGSGDATPAAAGVSSTREDRDIAFGAGAP